jgi:protease IV
MIDSPGGMVDGTATFADVIKASTKPVIAFIDDGMAASAAYWIASYANEIIASQPTDQIGSIGAYSTLADFTGAYEKDGIKIKTVYAPQSTEKNEEHRQAFEHNNIKPAEASIGRIAQEFIDKIKENRSGKININVSDPFKGKIFFADEALKIGLIDSIGNLDFAVNRAQKLASDREKFTLKFNS